MDNVYYIDLRKAHVARNKYELNCLNSFFFLKKGAWTLHFPIFKMLHEEISADSIGDIMVLDVQFGIK